jgi:MFS family permease
MASSVFGAGAKSAGADGSVLPKALDQYAGVEAHYAVEQGIAVEELSLLQRLSARAADDPMNWIATLIFFLAIIHTFAAGPIMQRAHKEEHRHKKMIEADNRRFHGGKAPVSFKATALHFFGEVEAIFGIWVLPLLLAITLTHGWHDATAYIDTRNFTEPLFVVVIMAIAASRPVVVFAEGALRSVASLGKQSPAAWWLSILIIAPLLGSFITEPAAMTIAAMLLGQQFYRYDPTPTFKYATLGLLFVNISVGGTLTHFAAPPVLMVAGKWDWNMPFMFTHFGWRAILGILVVTTIYFLVFRKSFARLTEKAQAEQAGQTTEPVEPVPSWVIGIHLAFLAWTVFTLHHPALFIGGFLIFVAFNLATVHHQYAISLKGPILVGFFLAGLVTHGGMQGWWIAPVLSALGEVPLFIGATVLTAFNDNAAITFLAAQVPAFANGVDGATALQYAVVAGAVSGGGLTVIANAPNPAGQSILSKYFSGGVSPLKLLLGALFPTLVMAVMFMVLPH